MKTQYGLYATFDSILQAWKPGEALMVNLSDEYAVMAYVRSILAIKDPIDRKLACDNMRFYRLGFLDVASPCTPLIPDLCEITNQVLSHPLLSAEVKDENA